MVVLMVEIKLVASVWMALLCQSAWSISDEQRILTKALIKLPPEAGKAVIAPSNVVN